jgi:hypothetical protein
LPKKKESKKLSSNRFQELEQGSDFEEVGEEIHFKPKVSREPPSNKNKLIEVINPYKK